MKSKTCYRIVMFVDETRNEMIRRKPPAVILITRSEGFILGYVRCNESHSAESKIKYIIIDIETGH